MMRCLSNAESIRVTIELLSHQESSQRWQAARSLGDLGRLLNGAFKEEVVTALQARVDDGKEVQAVRDMATRSVQEINGEFDNCSEKYRPQEPVGSLRDQYYLKRG